MKGRPRREGAEMEWRWGERTRRMEDVFIILKASHCAVFIPFTLLILNLIVFLAPVFHFRRHFRCIPAPRVGVIGEVERPSEGIPFIIDNLTTKSFHQLYHF